MSSVLATVVMLICGDSTLQVRMCWSGWPFPYSVGKMCPPLRLEALANFNRHSVLLVAGLGGWGVTGWRLQKLHKEFWEYLELGSQYVRI